MNHNQSNPLLCNPDSGVCEIPSAASSSENASAAKEKAVKLIYFTDPICSSCWGIEPQLRKLKLEYGDLIEIEYHMGGLLPSWNGFNGGGITKPADVAVHWDEVSAYYQMPIDGDVWLEDPLNSSYPPSVAFCAAQMQDSVKAELFLRRIREMVFTEKKNITRWEHLQAAAFSCGLDTAQLKTDFSSGAETAFQQDLAYARKLGVRGFPTLFAVNAAGAQEVIYGYRPYAQFEETIRKLHPQAVKKTYTQTAAHLFDSYGTLTAKEYAVLASLTPDEAEKQLNELTQKGVLSKHTCKNGSIWKKK
ncbi:MAG: DsbA family protein [Bacteroidetes bacterium]|nr:DsbA family protein [Bacteroidota bacterium]